ncbi:hypothetical protein BJQ96_03781 [Flavobacterium sp. PL0002]|nr:hypothetical protein [Flavobacterium sp. PL002]
MRKYTKSFKLDASKLELNDLNHLVEIITKTFSENERSNDFEILTRLDDLDIRSESLEEFLKHRELPNKLNNLSISMTGWNENGNIDKSVRLLFYKIFTNLDVNGDEETWVIGKSSQINEFLKKKRPWHWLLNKIFPYATGVIFAISLFYLSHFLKNGEIIYSISTGIFFLSWILATFFFTKGTFLPHVQIILNRDKSLLNKENITILISILSLIVSIIGGIILPLINSN